MLSLFNTLSRQKEPFKPIIPNQVGIYSCGPTVYQYPHIGNLRAYVFTDTLKQALRENGYEVKHVINITDVGHLASDADEGEDKIERAARQSGRRVKDIADHYTSAFFEDLNALNIDTDDVAFPRASLHIAEQITLIKRLEEKGFTYLTPDGVYFSIEKYPDYAALGKLELTGLRPGARVEINAKKRHPADFALWKLVTPEARREQEWDSPWGRGFPGWHIECSAMSMKYLGEHFDIHTGGEDHIPVHHTNERAQSESVTGRVFVNYWLHNAFLTVGGSKISKSSGNSIYLKNLAERQVPALAFRYWLLTAHYRSPVDFTWEALGAVQEAYDKLKNLIREIKELAPAPQPRTELKNNSYWQRFRDAINDDLGTPSGLAIFWEAIRSKDQSTTQKLALAAAVDRVLRLKLLEFEADVPPPAEVTALLMAREKARQEINWEEADRFRQLILDKGYKIKDTKDGSRLKKIK